MCGIVAYLGSKEAAEVLIAGLKRLEYRGYDSAGIALVEHDKDMNAVGEGAGNFKLVKKKGKVANLEAAYKSSPSTSTIGIGHTRWATHGEPCDRNSHPHTNPEGDIAVVHNGIIENYQELKRMLQEKGNKFTSDTDTEVLAHLVGQHYKE